MNGCPPIKPRHIGVAGAGLLLLSAVALWLASLQRVEQVAGFKPVTLDSGAGYAIERWQLPVQQRWLYLWGMGLCLVGTGTLTVVKVDEDSTLLNLETLRQDIPDTITVLTAHTQQFLATGIQTAVDWTVLIGGRTAKTIYLRTAPAPLKDAITQMAADRTWFKQFLKARHNWVTGKTGSGKTFLTLALIADWLQDNPDGTITICDLAYGKPDENGFINDWLGLPVDYIRMEPETIAATIQLELEELETRRKQGQEAAKNRKCQSTTGD
jgi:hypothetical protein